MNLLRLEEILDKYKEILTNKVSREEAESWADKLIQAEDDYNLVYVPKHDEKKIWEELTFLSMIDSQNEEPKNGKKNYFFQEEDIKNHVKSIEDYKNNKK